MTDLDASRGYGSRILGSIKGVLVGVVLFLVAFPLLWWNEGRAVLTAGDLEDADRALVQVAADRVDAANDRKLVYVSGAALVHDTLRDPVFAVSAEVLRLARVVEMYQWVETSTEKGDPKTVTYEYEKKWSERLVDSSTFKQRPDHANPTTMPYDGKDMVAPGAMLGAFALSDEAIKRLAKFEELPVDEGARAKLAPELMARTQVDGGKLFLGKSPKDLQIGDVRVSFRVIRPQIVSVVAEQSGGALRVHPTKAGDGLLRIEAGAVDAATLFPEARAGNDVLTWILRALGFALMALGATLFLRPIAAVADFIPKIGSLVSLSAVVFAVVVSLGLSSVTIAAAWIAHRPLVGIAVLLGGAGALALAVVMARAGKRGRARVA